jgi:hypothetical protein
MELSNKESAECLPQETGGDPKPLELGMISYATYIHTILLFFPVYCWEN